MLTLLADLGDLFRLHPALNAATLLELLERQTPTRTLLWATPPNPEHPAWYALEAGGYALETLYPDWAWAEGEQRQMFAALEQFPKGKARLHEVGGLERELLSLLTAPLTVQRVYSSEVLGQMQAHHARVAALLEEGPATAHRERRLDAVAALLAGREGVALVPLDDLPDLLGRLPAAHLPEVEGFAPSERSRLRALADRAQRLEEGDDLGALLEGLMREEGDPITPRMELEYAGAGIYLSVGDLESARVLLERAGHAQLEGHLHLFALTYARLGQVRDLQGERDGALRAYRATLALPSAPEAARSTAEAGLRQPFTLEGTAGAHR